MKNIKLDIKKQTFEKYLLEFGYQYKILEYDKFIEKIKREIYTKLSNSSFVELESAIDTIFSNKDNLDIFNKNNYSNISSNYIISLIDDGILDIFLEEKEISYSKKVQELAYQIDFLKEYKSNFHIKNIIFREDFFASVYNKSSIEHAKALNCLSQKAIELSDEEKNIIKKDIRECISDFTFESIEKELIPIYLEFIFYILKDLNTLPKAEIIDNIIYDKLEKGIFIDSISISKYVRRDKAFKLFKDIRKTFSKESYMKIFEIYLDLLNDDKTSLNKALEPLSNEGKKVIVELFDELLKLNDYKKKENSFRLKYNEKERKFTFSELWMEYKKRI